MLLQEAPPPYSAKPKKRRNGGILITRENAREMQKRATESRRLRKLELHARVQKALNCDPYLEERLAHVRTLIHRLEGMAHRQRDAGKLAHLTKALATLTETEAKLAGRTKPTRNQDRAAGAAPLIQAES